MYKHYYIALIDEDLNEWGILESSDLDYISKVFEDIAPQHIAELRGTDEDLDTHLGYEVIGTKRN